MTDQPVLPILSAIPPLTPEQRESALSAARRSIAGDAPEALPLPTAHDAPDPDALPKRLEVASIVLTLVLACIGFIVSAIRVHQVALQSLGDVVTHPTSLYLSALLTVVLSEVGAIALQLAAIRVPDHHVGWGRVRFNPYSVAYQLGSLACAGIAISGNAKAMSEITDPDLYVYLETYVPPVITLITAYALKTQLVESIKAKHRAMALLRSEVERVRALNLEAQRTHAKALAEAHTSDGWLGACARAYMDMLLSANRSVAARAQHLRAASKEERTALVVREINADRADWFELPPTPAPVSVSVETPAQPPLMPAPSSGKTHGTPTGELSSAVAQAADGAFVATCPRCGKTYRHDTHRKAMNALVAHMKTHPTQRD